MRILVAHSHLNTFGGGERATLELLRELAPRHDVMLWAGNYRPDATFAELAAFPRRELAPWEWLAARPDADLVVTQTFGANLLALRSRTVVAYVHTLRSVYLSPGVKPTLRLRYALDQVAIHRARAVATNSAYSAKRIAALYGRQAQIILPGANLDYTYIPPHAGTYALYVGRLAPEKGLERLLRWSRDVAYDLMLVGAGERAYERHLQSIAGPRVTFRGPLTGEALAAAYAGCRYLVLLAHSEEFGLAALDAMAAAKPVLATPEGGLADLVRDGTTGYLVQDTEQFNSASLRLLENDTLCLQLGAAGRAFARHYTWARFARQIEGLSAATTV